MRTLKQLRERAGLKQSDVAAAMFVTRDTVSKWERGVRELKAWYIPQLCKVLKCTPYELLGMKEE